MLKIVAKLLSISYLFFFLTLNISAQDQEIRICRSKSIVSSYLYIAEQQKYFEEEGIKANFETASNLKLCLDLVTSGRVDFTNVGDGPLTYASISNPPYKVIAKAITNPDIAVYARKDSGINKIEDLKGKKLGYLPGSVSYMLLTRLLKKYGWNKSDFILVPMQPPAMVLSLSGKIVDAILIWEPWGSQSMLNVGDEGVVFPMGDLYMSSIQIITHDKIIKSSPDLIKKMLRIYLKAEEYILKNKDKTIDFMSEKLSFPKVILQQNWDSYRIRLEFTSDIKKLLTEDFGLLKKYDENFAEVAEPDFDKLFDKSFLKEVAGERVVE